MAELLRLTQPGTNQTTLFFAIEGFLAATDLAATSRVAYSETLERLLDEIGDVSIDDITRTQLQNHLSATYGHLAPATFNRHLATVMSLFSWCSETELIVASPAKGLRRRKQRVTIEAERQARPIALAELEAIWSDSRHSLRDRTFWVMAYDTAARAAELLSLDIEQCTLANHEATIIGKGGSAERLFWSSTTARLLPRLIAGRRSGPVFIGDRKPRAHLVPAQADLCPTTGKARLSYRRAAEIWKKASDGHTLHQLRHSRLTHLAEEGVDVTMIKGKSRHRSLRSLERYVSPSADAIRDLTHSHDPNRRSR